MSKIEWTGKTWNPTIGCSKVSEGCEHCYAIKEAWIRMGNPNQKIQDKFAGTVMKTKAGNLNWTGNINLGQDALTIPLRTKAATLWFVNSMSDLFHPNMPQDWQDEIMAVMALCGQHTFQVLTKHPDNMLEYFRSGWVSRVAGKLSSVYQSQNTELFWLVKEVKEMLEGSPPYFYLPNLWLGVSVENQQRAEERIPLLLQVPAAVRFLSCEPLLGRVDISKWLQPYRFCNKCGYHGNDYTKTGAIDGIHEGCSYSAIPSRTPPDIHWVIVGGESGPDARPMHPVWAQHLRNQCEAAGVRFFFKQWGEWAPQEHWKDTQVRQKCYMWEDGSTEVDVYVKNGKGGQVMGKVGKKKAGHLLDFNEYRQMPKVNSKTEIPNNSI